MKTLDLYASFLKNAKIKKSQVVEFLGEKEYIETCEEFTISNKQGFFIKSLMMNEPFSKRDSLIIFQDCSTRIVLVNPPHFIKLNGFFMIRKFTLTLKD